MGRKRCNRLDTEGYLLAYGLDIKALPQTYLPKSLSYIAQHITLWGWVRIELKSGAPS